MSAQETPVCNAPVRKPSEEGPELTAEELARLNDLRASQYALMARLFRVEVDQELLDELRATRFPAKTGDAETDEGYRLLVSYLGGAWVDPIKDLAVDYAHVFIGNGTDAYGAAYPFESVYTSEKRLLMQDARDEVRAIYRSFDLDKDASWREGEDHIALELEFMKVLAERTARTLREGDEDSAAALLASQRNFLHDHLLRWAPMMAGDMKRLARTDFYRGAARLLCGMLSSDAEFLDAIVAEED